MKTVSFRSTNLEGRVGGEKLILRRTDVGGEDLYFVEIAVVV